MTSVTIVTDIYGITPELSTWLNTLKPHFSAVYVISPYQGDIYCESDFDSENDIYQMFLNTCGHDNYVERIEESLQAQRSDVVIAFSAGASACWRAFAKHSYNVQHFIGLYPSQIRHHTSISPNIPTCLIMPAHEPHFSVDNVIEEVSKYSQVKTIKTPWLHGFFNPYSDNFNTRAKQVIDDLILYKKTLDKPQTFAKQLANSL